MAVKYNTILIRFGEIFLKGNNRAYFESILIKNIKDSIKDLDCKFTHTHSRYFVEDFNHSDSDEIIGRLTKVFGIHSISPCVKVATSEDAINEVASDMLPERGTFRITVKRADKRIQKRSMDIAAEIGAYCLRKVNTREVDLFNPQYNLNVDIRENGVSYLFYDTIKGAGGLPVGSSGKCVLLLSGGIDSPVAGYMMAKRGVKLICVHFHSFPYTSEQALQKVKDLAQKILPYTTGIELHVVPFTEIQYAIHENCPEEFMITIMRRFMMRIAETIARRRSAGAIVTGESLGQVASQTMESINVTNSVVKLPVFRPLIAMDKEEVIAIANKIDTFNISIRPYEDCCTVFLPKNPVIHPKIKEAEEYQSKLDTEGLIEKALANTEVISYN